MEWPPAVGRVDCVGGWEASCSSGVEFCRSFPAPTRISAEKKNFSLVTPPGITVRNSLPASARNRIQLGPGKPGKPAPRAEEGAGRGRPRSAAGSGRPARAALPTAGSPAPLGRWTNLGRARPPPPSLHRPQSPAAGLLSR